MRQKEVVVVLGVQVLNKGELMDSKSILSDIVVFNKYAKYIPVLKRRETFEEIVTRNMLMHIEKYPFLESEIREVYANFVLTKKVLPSMRALQFSGKPIQVNPTRIYNCSYLPIDHPAAFSESMFLLLGGCGVGYSVQFHHIEKLPTIKRPGRSRRYLVGDSIEGWADAVKMLVKAFFNGKSLPSYDFSDIREKGEPLVTAGGKAPGPEPLKNCLHKIQSIFERKEEGEQLSSIEVHDIICHIADAVLAGGIRRAACIAIFSMDDEDMLSAKQGAWWELNPQRGRANNSALILRHRSTEKSFKELWDKIKHSGCGEPGFIFSNNADWGVNPCCEISLRPNSFCNLCEVNISDITDQEDLNSRVKAASFIGTLQAGYTNFHYLRDVWKKTTEKEALIGVSCTGIASNSYLLCNLEEASKSVVEENKRVASLIGINPAARTTTVKPAGTTSLVLGTSSGIHAWFSKYYIRRMKIGKSESLYSYLKATIPELLEDDKFSPKKDAFVFIPIKAPDDAVVSENETAISLLERIKVFSEKWISPGHIKGDNKHNVSATVYIKEDEWDSVADWMWKNRDSYNGLSVLPFDGGTYSQTPFEAITKEKYEELVQYCRKIDLSQVIEEDNKTDLKGEIACSGGVCELQF